MKNILVTGAGGFIGSHLSELLISKGYNVKVFLHYNSKNNWGWLEESNYKNDFEIITGDIRDYDSVYNSLKNVDTVFHLAALIGIPYSYVSPLAYIRTNIEGTYNVLQASRVLEIENVLITSTSETYGTAQYVPIDEKHPLVGQSPYSASKIGADQIALSFYRSFGLPVKVVRPFNTFGPRQSARAIIPTIISQILAGVKEIKLGNLTTTRDLTYVLDTANGFYEIAKSNKTVGEVTNIGMNTEISMNELVKLIIKLTNKRVSIVVDEHRIRPEKSEVERLLCNSTKIKELTDWKADYNLDLALKETIGWFTHNKQLYKHNLYNL
jgi:NAD dependent epimerase/dehydratase